MTTHVLYAVDRSRSAWLAAARPDFGDRGGARLRLALVNPKMAGVVDHLGQALGHGDERMTVLRSRLDQGDLDRRVFRQPIGRDAAAGAGPGDGVVVVGDGGASLSRPRSDAEFYGYLSLIDL